MTKRLPLSATIITCNEEGNLPRCLRSLAWVDEVIVVDSGSRDNTINIAKAHGARVFQKEWRGYGQQKNFAMSQATHDWVLNLDADEEVSDILRESIEYLLQEEEARKYAGAKFARRTWFLGRWIMHGGWYPNVLVRLSRKSRSRWTEPQVHEALLVDGNVKKLVGDLHHYTFRDVGDQVTTNVRYAREGARVALQRGESPGFFKLLHKPIGKFLETYIWKRGFLDGLPGFIISVNAAHSMFMKYAEMLYPGRDSDDRQA